MERVLADFTPGDQGTAASLRPSLAILPSSTPMEVQPASTIQTMDLCSSIFDSDFQWDNPEHGPLESLEVEYVRPDPAFLLEPGFATSAAGKLGVNLVQNTLLMFKLPTLSFLVEVYNGSIKSWEIAALV